MQFHFRLMSMDGVPPWEEEPLRQKDRCWYGLTLAWIWIEIGDQELFRYSQELLEHLEKRYKMWSHERLPYAEYQDYQAAQYWEELLERLPAILEPLPDDLAARVADAAEWKSWQERALAWQERQADESAWNLYYRAVGWWDDRTWSCGHLKHPPHLWLWRVQNTVYVRWDNRDVRMEGRPVWTAQQGEYALPAAEFVAEVAAFHRRFLLEMEPRRTETGRVRSRYYDRRVEIEFPLLAGEPQDRSRRFEAALQPGNSPWEEMRRAMAAMEKALELDQRRLRESDRLIDEGDRFFHSDTQASAEAQPLYQEALLLRLAALGEQDERVAVAMNRLANVYYQQKNDVAAGALFERALAIREAVLSPDAPDLRLSVNNLANVYRNQGRFAEAEPLYRRSLQMREQETGHSDHPAIWKNLVRVLEGQGKTGEAAEYLQRIQRFEAAQDA